MQAHSGTAAAPKVGASGEGQIDGCGLAEGLGNEEEETEEKEERKEQCAKYRGTGVHYIYIFSDPATVRLQVQPSLTGLSLRGRNTANSTTRSDKRQAQRLPPRSRLTNDVTAATPPPTPSRTHDRRFLGVLLSDVLRI